MSGIAQALNIFFVILSDMGLALLVGVLLAGHWLEVTGRAAAACERGLWRLSLACVAALLLSDIVRPWFVAASMSGSSQFLQTLALTPTVLSSTRSGRLWFINSLLLAVLLFAVIASPRVSRTWSVRMVVFLLAAVKAASGHAADQGDFTVTEFSQFLHILATAVWAGAIVVSGILILPQLRRSAGLSELWEYGKRLSSVVTWALVILVASGVYNADREMNGVLHTLWTSGWGRVLLLKVSLVGLALLLGATSRFRCLNREATSERSALLAMLMRTEAVVMILILSFSGLLANTMPPMSNG